MMADRRWWTLNVHGYGEFQYFGTEDEAEGMRRHKANWEGGVGKKRRATSHEAILGRDHLEWQHDHKYPLDERELEALGTVEDQGNG